MQFSKERLKLIETLLEAAGWEREDFEGEVVFKTPKHFKLEYWHVGSYRIYDAIRYQIAYDKMKLEAYNETSGKNEI
jgi:hypothetical protein